MEKHNCKFCLRSFASGKALGGHMKSHMVFGEVEKVQDSDDSESVYFMSSSGDETEDQKAGKKRSVPVESESETETETSKLNYPTFKRSKRVPKSKVDGFFQVKNSSKAEGKRKINEHSSLSSITIDSPEEDIAHCLMMMSRDKWTRVESVVQAKEVEVEEEEEYGEDDYFSEDSGFGKVVKSSNKVRGKYKCDTCNKLFKSYQALGGHRTSHKKSKVDYAASGSQVEVVVVAEKVYECPYCDRVFTSGQAFGGHKRSHSIGRGTTSSSQGRDLLVEPIMMNVGGGLELDLNLPAPDEDVDEVSNYAVSDAEFGSDKQ